MTTLHKAPESAPKGAPIPPSLAMPTAIEPLGPPAAPTALRVASAEIRPVPAESAAWPRVFPGL